MSEVLQPVKVQVGSFLDTSPRSVTQVGISKTAEYTESSSAGTTPQSQNPLLHSNAHPDGGLGCYDAALMKAQRRAIVDVVKMMSKNLLTGNLDLLKVSLPVRIFEPRSYLEKLSDAWVFPQYLDAAAQASDPVARLKLVTTYFVAGFHRVFSTWSKPFNPILGETWQAHLADGSHIFLEQICHHPPVSAYVIYGAEGRYTYEGTSEPSVSYRTSGVSTHSRGARTLRFGDGGAVRVEYPVYELKGLIGTGVARAELSGSARFVDDGNGLSVTVRFGALGNAGDGPILARSDALCGVMRRRPDAPAAVAALPALDPELVPRLKADSATSATSYLTGKARAGLSYVRPSMGPRPSPPPQEHDVVAACVGNWMAFLDWDGERRWTLATDKPARWEADLHSLPSDCRFRRDLEALASGDMSLAQETKERMEHMQRHDAKLRKAGCASPAADGG